MLVWLSPPPSPIHSPLPFCNDTCPEMPLAHRQEPLQGKAPGCVKRAMAVIRCQWCWCHGDAPGAGGTDAARLLHVDLHPYDGSSLRVCHNRRSKHGCSQRDGKQHRRELEGTQQSTKEITKAMMTILTCIQGLMNIQLVIRSSQQIRQH
jgi:hypothetical protein